LLSGKRISSPQDPGAWRSVGSCSNSVVKLGPTTAFRYLPTKPRPQTAPPRETSLIEWWMAAEQDDCRCGPLWPGSTSATANANSPAFAAGFCVSLEQPPQTSPACRGSDELLGFPSSTTAFWPCNSCCGNRHRTLADRMSAPAAISRTSPAIALTPGRSHPGRFGGPQSGKAGTGHGP